MKHLKENCECGVFKGTLSQINAISKSQAPVRHHYKAA